MKKLFFFFSFSFSIFHFELSQAQNVGIGTNAPNESAQLDVTSTNRGFLPPRMTFVQRNAIVNPAEGLIIFQTDSTKGIWVFQNNQWALANMMQGSAAGQMMYWNGSTWLNVNPGSYGQNLVFCDGVPTWGGCEPKVTTSIISYVTNTSALCGGNVTADGGSAVTSRGICWSTTMNPTVYLTTKTIDGSGAGGFTSNITGLTPNTSYYVRAYSTNTVGTSYGVQKTFTTTNNSFVNLPSVTIGTQIWINKNLDAATYRNGDPIPQVTDATQWVNLTTGAWCWYNNDSATYAATYGRLYNWYAVNDPRGLAPQGWHVPSDAEWKKLIKYIDPAADTTIIGYQSTTAGGALKETGTSHWSSPNTGAANSSGFAGLPGGTRNDFGAFNSIGYGGFWWSSSEYGTTDAWNRGLYYGNADVYRGNYYKADGFSVRLVRD